MIAGVVPGPKAVFSFQGRRIEAFAGESVAAALLREGIAGTRTAPRTDERRGYYCGMGVCWECVVEIEGEGTARGCLYPVSDGLVVHPATARPADDL